MTVSLSNIPKDSQVYRFITSGKRGRCALCSKMVDKLEAHHVSYSPEKTINLCHNCHHKVHFWPQRLADNEKLKLLSKRFSEKQALEIINKKMLGPSALAKLVAPSRQAFIHASQKADQRKLKQNEKSSHSREVQKVNKEADLSFIKRLSPKKVK